MQNSDRGPSGSLQSCVFVDINPSFQIIIDENLAENAKEMGRILRREIVSQKFKCITDVRGKGLLSAIVVHESKHCFDSTDLSSPYNVQISIPGRSV